MARKCEFPGDPWCITIPRLHERRQLFEQNWGSVNFHVGFDYLDSDVRNLLKTYKKQAMFSTENAAWLAMYFGHLTLWKKLLDSQGDRWVIFEDDACPTGDAFIEPCPEHQLVRYFRAKPKFPSWVGTACYYATRKMLERLVDCRIATSPDRVLKSVEDHDPVFLTPLPVCLIDTKPSYPPSETWIRIPE